MKPSNPKYLKIRQAFMELLRKYPDNHRPLPSERELSTILNVSRGTLRSVMNELVVAGNLVKRPGSGTFVITPQKTFVIGALFYDGGEYPYFHWWLRALGGIIDALDLKGFGLLPLSSRDAGNDFPRLIHKHNLDGLLWIAPTPRTLSSIAYAIKNGARVCALLDPNIDLKTNPLTANYIAWDSSFIGRQRADFFLKRKREKVGIFSESLKLSFEEFRTSLANAGTPLREELRFQDVTSLKKRLPGYLKAGLIDGIVSNGGMEKLQPLMEILHKNNKRQPIDVLIPDIGGVRSLLREYPSIDSIALSHSDIKAASRLLCQTLLKHIESGVPQAPELTRPQIVNWSKELQDIGE